MNDYPGYEFATSKGYTLHNYSGNMSSATYIKDGIFLTVKSTGVGVLEKVYEKIGRILNK